MSPRDKIQPGVGVYRVYSAAGCLRLLFNDFAINRNQIRELRILSARNASPAPVRWELVSPIVFEKLLLRFTARRGDIGAFCAKLGISAPGFDRAMRSRFGSKWALSKAGRRPKQSPYRLGRAFEYRVRDHFRSCGYWAQRSPASKTKVDIIALRPGEAVFIQCKRRARPSRRELNQLLLEAKKAGAKAFIASSKTGRGIDFERIDEVINGN